MEFSQIREVADEAMLGQRVRLRGWLYRRHETEHYIDLIIRDQTGFIVCRFMRDGVSENTAVRAAGINERSSVKIEGVVNRDEDAISGFRIEATDLDLIDEAEDIDVSSGETDHFYRDINELWKYPDRSMAISHIRSRVMNRLMTFFRRKEWCLTDPPFRVNEAHEGGMFVEEGRVIDPLPFLEAASYVFGDVYTLYEGQKNRRIAAVSSWSSLEDIEDLARDMVSRIGISVAKGSHPELDTVGRDYDAIRAEAADIETRQWEELDHGDQEGAGESLFRELGEEQDHPLLVQGRERSREDIHLAGEGTVETFSIVAPDGYGRLVEGFAFETETSALLDRFRDHGLDPDGYEWLMDLRRDGVRPYAGLKISPTVFTKWLAGVRRDRDVSQFYYTDAAFDAE